MKFQCESYSNFSLDVEMCWERPGNIKLINEEKTVEVSSCENLSIYSVTDTGKHIHCMSG